MLLNTLRTFLLLTLFSCASPKEAVVTELEQLKTNLAAVTEIRFKGAIGTGFVFNITEKDGVFYHDLLTAAHLVRNEGTVYPTNASNSDPSYTDAEVVFKIENQRIITTGTIVKVNREDDLAVIRVGVDRELCLPFAIRQNDLYLNYLNEVEILSFPLGVGPIVSRGFISGLQTFEYDKDSYITNAQTAPGSSGGPVIELKTGKVIGMLRAVLQMTSSGQDLGWCSIITPAKAIRDFVNEYSIEVAQHGGGIVVTVGNGSLGVLDDDSFTPSDGESGTEKPAIVIVPGLNRGEGKDSKHVNKGIIIIMKDYIYTEEIPQYGTDNPFDTLNFKYENRKNSKSN